MSLQLFCQIVLGLTFAAAVAGKVRSRAAWRAFAGSVGDLGLVPAAAVRPLAVLTVAAESGVVAAMAVPGLARPGFLLALALLAALTGGIVAVLRAGRRADCHCFGGTPEAYGPLHVVRNLLLLTVAGLGAVSATPETLRLAEVLPTVLAAVPAAMVAVRFTEIFAVFDTPQPTSRS
ncbi:hypothetical protein GCM10010112_47760 [Actinoplanes lobatus]|uniref:Methylamine utilisation protein MauE domain-containing protein n=1 Tax=Actinoplanes lobatus TaxID=113568 RepID=A0A7W7MH96_9ACTN|nr:MauE/DoxX family redox-associated membrane protein [Actinoplanes lobatus]MBB4749730.1 hypothetical protein [Actinoplanes lobatus]GGN75972.1 hypothetical protein GCM10010112_47760 [Actinoplanes lobatus]GIE38468.1 hypothetical protein Alo02nite_13660 [Actinoplanes lobatus]